MMTCESLYSNPDHPLLKILKENAEKVFKAPCANTIRVGGTDVDILLAVNDEDSLLCQWLAPLITSMGSCC